MPDKYINLKELNEQDAKLLAEFLRQPSSEIKWKKNTPYQLNDTNLRLSHRIIKRKNKKGDLIYEVVDHEKILGRGSFGKVYEVLMTLKMSPDNTTVIAKQNNRAIKIQAENIPDKIVGEKEYRLAPDYLKMKAPLYWKKTPAPSFFDPEPSEKTVSALVMKKIPGMSLADVVDQAYKLTSDETFNLSLSLLNILLEHVYKKNIAHTDLEHGRNVLVNVNTSPIKAYIIDFGVAHTNIDTDMPVPLSELQVQDNYYIAKYISKLLQDYINRTGSTKLSIEQSNKINNFINLLSDYTFVSKINTEKLYVMFLDIYHDYLNSPFDPTNMVIENDTEQAYAIIECEEEVFDYDEGIYNIIKTTHEQKEQLSLKKCIELMHGPAIKKQLTEEPINLEEIGFTDALLINWHPNPVSLEPFGEKNKEALLSLFHGYNVPLIKAMDEIDSLQPYQLKALMDLYGFGLRGDHLRQWQEGSGFEIFTHTHAGVLEHLIVECQLSPTEAIQEISGLEPEQAKMFYNLYHAGLRGEHLRAWKPPTESRFYQFQQEHELALAHLIREKNIAPAEAVQLISGKTPNEARQIEQQYKLKS